MTHARTEIERIEMTEYLNTLEVEKDDTNWDHIMNKFWDARQAVEQAIRDLHFIDTHLPGGSDVTNYIDQATNLVSDLEDAYSEARKAREENK